MGAALEITESSLRRAANPLLAALDRARVARDVAARAVTEADQAIDGLADAYGRGIPPDLTKRRVECHRAAVEARRVYSEAYVAALGSLTDPVKVVMEARRALQIAQDEVLLRQGAKQT